LNGKKGGEHAGIFRRRFARECGPGGKPDEAHGAERERSLIRLAAPQRVFANAASVICHAERTIVTRDRWLIVRVSQ